MDMDDLLRKTLEKQAMRGTTGGRGRGRGRGGSSSKAEKKIGGRSLHLSYLIKDGLLKPGSGVLKMEYFGNVFEGDLLEDGSVKWKDQNLVFSTPSAWASHCKRLVNPEKKSACGWTTVKYEGRKLEWYKNKWVQLQAGRGDAASVIQQFQEDDYTESDDDTSGQIESSREASKTPEPLPAVTPPISEAASEEATTTDPSNEQAASSSGASQQPPYNASSSQQSPHNASSSQQPPHNASSSQQSPHNASSSQQPPHNASSSQQPPHNASSSQQSPHNASSSQQPPHNASSSQQPPHNASSSQQPPHNASFSQQAPHNASSSQPHHNGATPDQMAALNTALLEQAAQNHQIDLGSIAQLLLGDGAAKLSDLEKAALEKAIKEQMALEAALANRMAEAELLKQHSEAAALLQKQSKTALEQKKREEALVLAAQQEAVLQAQLQQEALMKIQQEILAAQKEKEEKEKRAKMLEAKSSKEKASTAGQINQGALQQTLLEHSMIQNALLNQAALEKAIQEHNASGSNDKMTQLILEQALFQQANMIQLAIAQLAEEQLKANKVKEPEVMKEARQDAVPAESSLIDCVKFSVVGQKQPYNVFISSNSLLLMDYHCHLSTDEVTGFLGGKWDPNKLTLHVQSVFPCSLNNPSDQNECNLLQNKIRELITQQDMTVIGWYHSHPTSSPRPSQHDIVCQSVHQQHMRSLDGRIDPCLGVIVSPFRGPSAASEMQLFCVMHTNDGRPVPMHLEYTCMWDSTISQALASEMRAMSILYAQQKNGVKFDQHWRNNINLFTKMTESLKQKTPKEISEEQFVEVMKQIIAREE